jgi:hypothetical protein
MESQKEKVIRENLEMGIFICGEENINFEEFEK